MGFSIRFLTASAEEGTATKRRPVRTGLFPFLIKSAVIPIKGI
jgi:hypothetical protein